MALEIVGALVGSAVASIFLPESFFSPPKDQTTVVRVHLGSVIKNASVADLRGNVPGIGLWDEGGQFIGSKPGSRKILEQGTFHDIEIVADPKVGNVPAGYVGISNGGDNAICISGITITFPDSTKAAWNADLGASCGAQFFYANNTFGPDSGNGTRCVFLDRDGTNGIRFQGLGMHISDFYGSKDQAEAYQKDDRLVCNSPPRFHLYEKMTVEDSVLIFDPPLHYTSNRTDVDPSKVIDNPGIFADLANDAAMRVACLRPDACAKFNQERCARVFVQDEKLECDRKLRIKGRSAAGLASAKNSSSLSNQPQLPTNRRFDGTLIVSSMEGQSAKYLCESNNSWGPPFVSLSEGLFCDMEDKTLYNVCGPDKRSCCFSMEQKTVMGCNSEGLRNRTLIPRWKNSTRTYANVQYWGSDTV